MTTELDGRAPRSVLVGLTPGERGVAALQLGAMMARSTGSDLVVAVIVPTPWPPNPYRADVEFLAVQEQAAQRALDAAPGLVGDGFAGGGLRASYRLHRARSVSSGLIEVVADVPAGQVVLGSSASGLLGRISLGGIADRLLHTSEVPITLAPAGYATSADARVTRVTVGFGRADRDSDLLSRAAEVASDIGAALRVACFAVRPLTALGGTIDPDVERLLVDEWAANLDADIARALAAAGGTVPPGGPAETVIGQGGTWGEALADVPWSAGDVLAIGASSSPTTRYFLGSHASKIVRNAPVPVVLTPRSLLGTAA